MLNGFLSTSAGALELLIDSVMGSLSYAAMQSASKGPTFWMPEQGSSVASGVDDVFYLIYWISIIFFIIIVVPMMWFVWRYRRRVEGEAVPVSHDHNTPLEVAWTAIPLLIVIGIFYVGFKGYLDLRTPPSSSYNVLVTGQMWNWFFQYPNGYVDSELHVPEDVPVRLTMTSEDVLHSFYVPAFRVKMDVVPGKYTTAWFEASDPGEYPLFCTEYCGTGHSAMNTTVVVHQSGTFKSWLEKAADYLVDVPPAEGGKMVYDRKGCAQCHSLDGSIVIGPSFKDLYGRNSSFTTGEPYVADDNYIRDSILNPQAHIVAGFEGVMPTYQGRIQDKEITALIAFLKSISVHAPDEPLEDEAILDDGAN
jgi:cytochrome c oxidase subunit 2